MSELRIVEKEYSGKRLPPEEADAVIAELKNYLMELADPGYLRPFPYRYGCGRLADGGH